MNCFARMSLLLFALPMAGCQALGPGGALSLAPAAISVDAVPGGPELLAAKDQFRAGNFGLAEEQYRRAVELAPRNAEAWLGLAATHDQLRRFDLADREYAQVEKLAGPSVALHNNRGYSQLLRGNLPSARRELQAARSLEPDNESIRINLLALKAAGGR